VSASKRIGKPSPNLLEAESGGAIVTAENTA
jgi:hypothetical protein